MTDAICLVLYIIPLLYPLAIDADLVYGINSTCLPESLLLGVPTESIGNGFIKAREHQPEKLLVALVGSKIPVHTEDMDYWLEKYYAG